MMPCGIERFVGRWVSASGYRLHITRMAQSRAFVDFLDPGGVPIRRPYMTGALTRRLAARYDDHQDMLEVDLWDADKGFTLQLIHEIDYVLDITQRESLVPGISMSENGPHLDDYSRLFGPLEHFVRDETQNTTLQ